MRRDKIQVFEDSLLGDNYGIAERCLTNVAYTV